MRIKFENNTRLTTKPNYQQLGQCVNTKHKNCVNYVQKESQISSSKVLYKTLTYYISLDGAAEGYGFLESHTVML